MKIALEATLFDDFCMCPTSFPNIKSLVVVFYNIVGIGPIPIFCTLIPSILVQYSILASFRFNTVDMT